VLPEKRHEPATVAFLRRPGASRLRHQEQVLVFFPSDGRDHPAAFVKLLEEGRG
jgi:hypothetical protein